MRSDRNLNPTLTQSGAWKQKLGDAMSQGDLAESLTDLRQMQGNQAGQIPSLSGGERNPFFLNRSGERFDDLSLISGADSEKDGRTVAIWDYDRDGFLDLAVINSNAPKLAIYQNQLAGELPGRNAVFLRLRGANTTLNATGKKSNRDGYGAVVRASVGGKVLRAEHRCGTGFAAQNSALMHLGIGTAEQIDSLTIRWPSGTVQQLGNLPAGYLVTITEGGQSSSTPYAR